MSKDEYAKNTSHQVGGKSIGSVKEGGNSRNGFVDDGGSE